MARDWALQLVPRSFVEVGTDHVPAHNGGKCVFPFYEASHVRCRRRAPLLAEPDQTPHITMWHYGCGRLLRCGCAGSMRREGYGGCAGAVVLGYGRSAPLNTGVECLSSPQHRGSKATCRPPCAWGSEKIPKVLTHRGRQCPQVHHGRLPRRGCDAQPERRETKCKKLGAKPANGLFWEDKLSHGLAHIPRPSPIAVGDHRSALRTRDARSKIVHDIMI